MQTDEGGITCQGGEYAAGISPLRGFFNNPLKGGVIYRCAMCVFHEEG